MIWLNAMAGEQHHADASLSLPYLVGLWYSKTKTGQVTQSPNLSPPSLRPLDIYRHGKVMSNINELKDKIDTKTANMVLLCIATAGLYVLLWLARNNKIISETTKVRLVDDTYIIWLAVCLGLGGLLSNSGLASMDLLSGILMIASSALYIVWAFKAKKALSEYALSEHKIDLRMNGFYTFFLHAFYINYCINDLPEEQRKQNILRGQTQQPQQV